ncbi:tripartite tricarboxylate transporter substrate binding protein [Achromobacter sp. ACRQX]|uniref:Bug family tripartite tricarboxylate transporter substrate binding protein n=1 Tax=Achromobacter sp. ACRQX TaxID=2918181 RepID=UPI001EF20800|nr:tripartite tricarboxylate transporter substrate binding protein [Achromobacter sp. ACRQX]MCG7324136.1 tripartite tricarboxylate transporter substrate binding protein [Achromobacter sp. ACRQX]
MNIVFKWKSRCAAWIVAGALGLAAWPAQAQYPERPITLVVPFAAGGAVDVVGRIFGTALGEQLGQTVVVENKAGASGNIGAQQVRRAKADGYTLLMAPTTSYVLNSRLMGKEVVGFDLLKDFRSVGVVGELPVVLVANREMGVKTLPELVSKVRAAPGDFAYGSSGPGTMEHAVAEMFRLREKLELLHVPYRGAAPAMVDLLAGQVQMMFATAPTALANLPGGRIVPVGVAARERLASLPDTPTLIEQGLPNFTASSVYAILVARDTPEPVVQALNGALKQLHDGSTLAEKLRLQGVVPVYTDTTQADAALRAEVEKWNGVVDATHIKLN